MLTQLLSGQTGRGRLPALQDDAGTFNIGTATGNALAFASGANINIEGGTITSTGRFVLRLW